MPIQVINPYDQELIYEYDHNNAKSVNQQLKMAEKAFVEWSMLPMRERVHLVKKALEYFSYNADEVARDISLQMGKPITEAHNEIKTLEERVLYMAEMAPHVLSPEVIDEQTGFYRRIEHVPIGQVLIVASWNYPLLTVINSLVTALICGNTVLIKHSTKTPLCAKHFEKAFDSLNIPGLVSSLFLNHRQTQRLVADPRVACVCFTGRRKNAEIFYDKLSSRWGNMLSQLYGNAPAYVARDANLEFSVSNIVDAACRNAGQSRHRIQQVYVHEELYTGFVNYAQSTMKDYRMGNPLDVKTTMGPMTMKQDIMRLRKIIKDATKHGAKVLVGGESYHMDNATYFSPTLITQVPQSSPLIQESFFGPVLSVQKVRDDAQALKRMQAVHQGISASLWTSSQEVSEYFAEHLKVGTVYQNRANYQDPALPWSQYGYNPGRDIQLSHYGFYPFTRTKSVHFRL